MTNSEKLSSLVLYPVDKISIDGALVDRGIDPETDYSVADYDKMQLSKADVFVLLITAPNVSEGGYTISVTEKKQLSDIASKLYDNYDVMNPLSKENIIDSERYW